MTIEKRPNGTYRVKIRMKGPDGLYVNPPDRTFKRRKDAEHYEDEVKVAVRRGTFNVPINKPWTEYIEEYLAVQFRQLGYDERFFCDLEVEDIKGLSEF